MKTSRWTKSCIWISLLITSVATVNPVAADFRLGEPANIGSPPNGSYADIVPSISSDGLEMYFWSNRPGGFGSWDLWVSRRQSTESDWSEPTNLGSQVNTPGIEAMPCISADGLELYFAVGTESMAEIMVTRRSATTQSWGSAENLGSAVNSSGRDDSPYVTSDGLELYFVSTRPGGRGAADIWVSSRPTAMDQWSTPVNVMVVNSGSHDQWVKVSGDGLTLLFQSARPGSEYGGLYMSRRASREAPWTTPVYLGLPMSGSVYTLLSSISGDGRMFYLSDHINYPPRSGGSGSADMWQVPVVPIIDFSDDGKVDMRDFAMLARHWRNNEWSVDVGPSPLGDGVVDIFDVFVLADHWLEDNRLIAHWKLDESAGEAAQDSVADYEGLLVNGPQWQPVDGAVDGALALDGIDDYVYLPFILNPRDGEFSIFMWVKGGGPEQVMMSQMDTSGPGRAWLCCDATQGLLMTELQSSGRGGSPLISEAAIADSQWHEIGLVWDGSYRHLYVDGEEAATDAAPTAVDSLRSSMFMGVGSNLGQDSHFSGLIDNVRIYNRAIAP